MRQQGVQADVHCNLSVQRTTVEAMPEICSCRDVHAAGSDLPSNMAVCDGVAFRARVQAVYEMAKARAEHSEMAGKLAKVSLVAEQQLTRTWLNIHCLACNAQCQPGCFKWPVLF